MYITHEKQGSYYVDMLVYECVCIIFYVSYVCVRTYMSVDKLHSAVHTSVLTIEDGDDFFFSHVEMT